MPKSRKRTEWLHRLDSIRGKRSYQLAWWKLMPTMLIPVIDPSEDPHPCVTMTNPFTGEGIEIDSLAQDIVAWCWDRGMETHNSCQGSMHLYDLSEKKGLYSAGHNPYSACLTMGNQQDARLLCLVLERALFRLESVGFRRHSTFISAVFWETDGDDGEVTEYWHVSFDPALLLRLEGEGLSYLLRGVSEDTEHD